MSATVRVPPKKCAGCGDWMIRKYWANGRREACTSFARRRYHDKTCQKLEADKQTSHRHCLHCGDRLHRKRFVSGPEPLWQFKERKWCSLSCYRLWLDEPENRAMHGRTIAKVLAKSQRFAAYHQERNWRCKERREAREIIREERLRQSAIRREIQKAKGRKRRTAAELRHAEAARRDARCPNEGDCLYCDRVNRRAV